MNRKLTIQGATNFIGIEVDEATNLSEWDQSLCLHFPEPTQGRATSVVREEDFEAFDRINESSACYCLFWVFIGFHFRACYRHQKIASRSLLQMPMFYVPMKGL